MDEVIEESPVRVEPAGDAAPEQPVAAAVADSGEEAGDQETVTLTVEALADETVFADSERAELKAVIEAVVYITDEPLTPQQIAGAIGRPLDLVKDLLEELAEDCALPHRGVTVRQVAGGYKMATKPEHHEAVRAFVKSLKPPLKLSLAALETLAVIAYKQPVTAPEIMEIRGVQGVGVLKTLIDRKLVATAGRKNVVGKPILYKTTREFMVQFGLSDLTELPTLKEFEELGRLALGDADTAAEPAAEPVEAAPESTPAAEASADPPAPASEEHERNG